MKLGFHQLLIKEEDRKWTTFITTKGVYRWKRLPFGPKNGPMFFQHVMRNILGDYVDKICKIFIDDICIYTDNNTEEELLINIDKVLSRLSEHNVRLSLSKCSFGNNNVKYLGYVVNEHGKQLPDSRVDGILKLAAPTTVKQVRTLLGMTNQFREYIKDYTTIIAPINELTKNSTKFYWSNECAHAFDILKTKLVERPKTFFLDYNLPLTLRVDASSKGCGGVLIQHHPIEGEQIIMFLSHTFSEQARKWATIEQEAFAIFYFIVIKLHNILLGHHFALETDHRNLVWLYSSETPKLVRWKLRLQEFDFTIVHIPGKTNIIADCISRLCAMSEQELRDSDVLSAYHNAYIGHHGAKATVKMLQNEGHHLDDMLLDVQKFIAACPTCQKVRLGQGSIEAAMNVRASMEPFQELKINFIGPLQPDEDGNTFILVVKVSIY